MDTKPVFHGSDIEKICSYYGLKKEDIVKFGANVNHWGSRPKPVPPLPHMLTFFPPIRTENTRPFAILFPNIAIFRQILFFPETAPAS